MICPSCDGRGEGYGFACGPSGCRTGALKCHTCKGSGQIDGVLMDRIIAGRKLHEDRQARNVSQREEAKRLGIDYVLYSKVEHGDITMEEAKEK